MRGRVPLAAVVASMGVLLGAPAGHAAESSAARCDTRTVPVQVGLASLSVSGTYCRPATDAPDSVFVLVPGATYTREYWDFQYQPDTYSFSRALVRAGHATFAIDRLGTGQSSIPASVTITASAQASAVHQVIDRLRGSGFDGHRFPRVLLAGHSLGSAISILEAATYRDVDGLVVTGLAHRFNAVQLTHFLTGQLHPAILDPAFAGTTLDPGYLTTRPGVRKEAFHDPGHVDPAVIQRDEATKDVLSATELPDAAALSVLLSYSDLITARVLIVLGSQDLLVCAAPSDCDSSETVHRLEQPYYSNAPCLTARVMPNVGHDVNLHPSAPVAQEHVASWARAIAGGNCPA